MKITVTQNKFHGSAAYYTGQSPAQAIRAARKHDCIICKCGGPTIVRADGAQLCDWSATAPFEPANAPWWEEIER